MLNHDATHRRIAALLTQRACNLTQPMQAAQMDLLTIRGFVNASSLCGYLVAGVGAGSPIGATSQRSAPILTMSLPSLPPV